MAKYAVVKYKSAVADPRTMCTVRSVLLVCLPPAPIEVTTVAIKGAAVISPSRWWIFSMCVRLSSNACSLALPWTCSGVNPKSSSEGAVLLLEGALGRLLVGA